MLDTGHFMNSNYELETPADLLAYLHQMLDEHESAASDDPRHPFKSVLKRPLYEGLPEASAHPEKQIRPSWPPRPSCIFFR